jgi:hypothetical protein
MEIVPATARDLEILTVFADKSSSRQHARGADQSRSPWPSEDLMAERVLRNIRAGETFIVWDDGGAAATMAVDRGANPTCGLGEAIEAPLYAHKRIPARLRRPRDGRRPAWSCRNQECRGQRRNPAPARGSGPPEPAPSYGQADVQHRKVRSQPRRHRPCHQSAIHSSHVRIRTDAYRECSGGPELPTDRIPG